MPTRIKRQRRVNRKMGRTAGQRRKQRSAKRTRRTQRGRVKMTIEGPFCAPTRFALTEALNNGTKGDPSSLFHLKITKDYVTTARPWQYDKLMAAELKTLKNLRYGGPLGLMYMGMVCRTDFEIDKAHQRLAEEIISRHPEIYVVKGGVDKNAQRRADKWGGHLPSGYKPKAFKSVGALLDSAQKCDKSGDVDRLPPKMRKQWEKQREKVEKAKEEAKAEKDKQRKGKKHGKGKAKRRGAIFGEA